MSTYYELHNMQDVRIVKEIICEHEVCTIYGEEERGVAKFTLAICDSCGIKVEGESK